MPGRRLTRIEKQLKEVFQPGHLEKEARRTRFERRESRVITPVKFLTSLLHSLGTRRVQSLADLHRDFNADHDTTVNYKPYYERLDTPGFVEWMRSTFEALMTSLHVDVLAPLSDSPFSRFDDVVIQDGTSFALHDQLASVFPGRFTTISPAAVELHVTMSLFQDNIIGVTVTPDSECERHHTPEPEQLRGKLLLADRGYDGRAYMTEIDDHGGHFLIRVRETHDPVVDKIHRRGKRYRKLEGKHLRSVLRAVRKGDVLDMDVSWPDRKGVSAKTFRLVAKYSGSRKGWMRLMTNLPRADFSTNDVFTGYRLRWQIELYFKELKSYANLHAFDTRKPHIAEGLFWASLCVAFLKRYMAHACQHVTAVPISTRRVAMSCHHFLNALFAAVRRRMRGLRDALTTSFRFISAHAARSNIKRERKKGRLAAGLTPVFGPG